MQFNTSPIECIACGICSLLVGTKFPVFYRDKVYHPNCFIKLRFCDECGFELGDDTWKNMQDLKFYHYKCMKRKFNKKPKKFIG